MRGGRLLKRIAAISLVFVALLAMAVPAGAVAPVTTVHVEGDEVPLAASADPIWAEGYTLAPAGPLAAALGAELQWDETAGQATIVSPDRSMVLWADSRRAVVNGVVRQLPAEPRRVGTTLYVPVRAVAEALGAYVGWDETGAAAKVMTGDAVLHRVLEATRTRRNFEGSGTTTLTKATTGLGGALPHSFSIKATWDLHTFDEDLLTTTTVEAIEGLPGATSLTTQLAVRKGQLYASESAVQGWRLVGAVRPNFRAAPILPDEVARLDPSQMDPPVLAYARSLVIGTEQLDDITVARVVAYFPPSATVRAGGKMRSDYSAIRVEFLVDPETAFLYQSTIAYRSVTTFELLGETITTEARVQGEARYRPNPAPVQFPDTFPAPGTK
jgi:hypothetical protein